VETAGLLLVEVGGTAEVEDTAVIVVIGDSELVELGVLFVTLSLLLAPPLSVAVGKTSEVSVGNALLGF